MEVLTRAEVKYRFNEIVELIQQGAIFIHPTDTIYGIGCVASNKESVEKVEKIKQRRGKFFSLWVPSIDWITEHCETNPQVETWLDKLPGPYTLILSLKTKLEFNSSITNNKTLGVRLPEHWFHKIVEVIGEPIITTSVNKPEEMFMTDLDNLDPDIQKQIRFCIYEGEKKGRPSTIKNLVTKEEIQR